MSCLETGDMMETWMLKRLIFLNTWWWRNIITEPLYIWKVWKTFWYNQKYGSFCVYIEGMVTQWDDKKIDLFLTTGCIKIILDASISYEEKDKHETNIYENMYWEPNSLWQEQFKFKIDENLLVFYLIFLSLTIERL